VENFRARRNPQRSAPVSRQAEVHDNVRIGPNSNFAGRGYRSGCGRAGGPRHSKGEAYAQIVRLAPVATALVGLGVVVFASHVRAGGDKVRVPEGFDKGVLYTTVDRADNKQYREIYTSQAAVDAAKKGEPMPDGTVVTLVQYRAKLGADGNPEKDANGRFIKGDLVAYTVMEKRKGWGGRVPGEYPQRRVGISGLHDREAAEPERQAHRLLRVPQAAAQASDFLFSYGKMAGK
jgi:hypothetical protein